jgi:hypothetical protein
MAHCRSRLAKFFHDDEIAETHGVQERNTAGSKIVAWA